MSLLRNDLREINEADVALLKKFFNGYDYRGAGYTFLSHYIWKDSYCVSWDVMQGYLCLVGTKCGKEDGIAFLAMPLIMKPEDKAEIIQASKSGAYNFAISTDTCETIRTEYEPVSLREAVSECQKVFEEQGRPMMFSSIPGHMVDIVKEAFKDADGSYPEFEHDEELDEYVYLKENLITLSGRALHKKKNHLNFFLRNYEYEAKPITHENKDDVLALAAAIRDYKAQDEEEAEDIENEFMAISQILNVMEAKDEEPHNGGDHVEDEASRDSIICKEECPVRGVAIYINGRLEAFAIGEIISETLAAEHFEKANDDYRGLYQLVCREYCLHLPESIVYVNREEDMGIPGLRQAKEALKPDHMDERYTVIL